MYGKHVSWQCSPPTKAPFTQHAHLACWLLFCAKDNANSRPDSSLQFRDVMFEAFLGTPRHDEHTSRFEITKDRMTRGYFRAHANRARSSETDNGDGRICNQVFVVIGMPRDAVFLITIQIHTDCIKTHV